MSTHTPRPLSTDEVMADRLTAAHEAALRRRFPEVRNPGWTADDEAALDGPAPTGPAPTDPAPTDPDSLEEASADRYLASRARVEADAMIAAGATVAAAWEHVGGTCDRAVCGGDHPEDPRTAYASAVHAALDAPGAWDFLDTLDLDDPTPTAAPRFGMATADGECAYCLEGLVHACPGDLSISLTPAQLDRLAPVEVPLEVDRARFGGQPDAGPRTFAQVVEAATSTDRGATIPLTSEDRARLLVHNLSDPESNTATVAPAPTGLRVTVRAIGGRTASSVICASQARQEGEHRGTYPWPLVLDTVQDLTDEVHGR